MRSRIVCLGREQVPWSPVSAWSTALILTVVFTSRLVMRRLVMIVPLVVLGIGDSSVGRERHHKSIRSEQLST
jgi:hypothetical protein